VNGGSRPLGVDDGATVLVTGGNGFVGSAVASLLERRGRNVRRVVRRPQSTSGDTVVVDIGPSSDWGAALEGVDSVIHVAGYAHRRGARADPEEMFRVNVAGTRALTAAARRAGVKTFVFVSSIGAVVERSDHEVDESATCQPETAYGRSKLAAEAAIAEERGSLRTVVLRPPLVYGRDAPGNFARLVTALRRNWPLPFAAVQNRRSFIFVGNLADGIVAALADHRADGVYHIADRAPVSTPDFIRAVASALNVSPRLWSVPERWLLAAGRGLSMAHDIRKLTDSLPIDATRFRHRLAWTPPWDMPTALAETFRQ
jgi:nucleoside-diphosphate-sugar epimerase